MDDKSCKTCRRCPDAGFNLSKCANCRLIHYCSTICQRIDWPEHRDFCYRAKNQFGKRPGPERAAFAAFSAAGLAKGQKNRACLICDGRGDCQECESTDDLEAVCAEYLRTRDEGAGAGAGAAAAATETAAPSDGVEETGVASSAGAGAGDGAAAATTETAAPSEGVGETGVASSAGAGAGDGAAAAAAAPESARPTTLAACPICHGRADFCRLCMSSVDFRAAVHNFFSSKFS